MIFIKALEKHLPDILDLEYELKAKTIWKVCGVVRRTTPEGASLAEAYLAHPPTLYH